MVALTFISNNEFVTVKKKTLWSLVHKWTISTVIVKPYFKYLICYEGIKHIYSHHGSFRLKESARQWNSRSIPVTQTKQTIIYKKKALLLYLEINIISPNNPILHH
jgi:hypothetical protein